MGYSGDDIQLMLKFKQGDDSCFEALVDRYKQRVFNLAYRFVGNYEEAEDIIQEVFINVYRSRNTYSPKAKFTTWLYTITKNTCLKKLRIKKNNLISINENIELSKGTVTRQIADVKSPNAAKAMIDYERSQIIKEAINSLPQGQKVVILLRRYDDLAYNEIAEVMKISAKAVKSLLHRARLNLKEKLKKYITEKLF